MNRTGFNGLCRSNARGHFNVPFGSYSTIAYETDLSPYRTALVQWTLATGDFEQLELKDDDFVHTDRVVRLYWSLGLSLAFLKVHGASAARATERLSQRFWRPRAFRR